MRELGIEALMIPCSIMQVVRNPNKLFYQAGAFIVLRHDIRYMEDHMVFRTYKFKRLFFEMQEPLQYRRTTNIFKF